VLTDNQTISLRKNKQTNKQKVAACQSGYFVLKPA